MLKQLLIVVLWEAVVLLRTQYTRQVSEGTESTGRVMQEDNASRAHAKHAPENY